MNYVWYKTGEALLEEIRREPEAGPGELAFWYIGQMGLIAKAAGVTVCFDPVLADLTGADGASRRNYPPPFAGEELTGVGWAVVSHSHADHMDAATLRGLFQANPGIRFVVPAPEAHRLREWGILERAVVPAEAGRPIELQAGAVLTPAAASHETYETDTQGRHRYLGYVLSVNDVRLYHAGDTVCTETLIQDVRRLGPIDVACLPINGAGAEFHSRGVQGNMDPKDAAYFARQTGADLTLPMHSDMVRGNEGDPLLFAYAMRTLAPGRKYHIPQLGERFLYQKCNIA